MDAGPDVTRIVRSWLRTDEHESADRILAIVLDQLDTTRQRRSWWPARRIDEMNTFTKLAIAATAVVVLAVVGINLLPGGGGTVGAPAASPSSSPTASPSPSPSPTTVSVFPPAGELAVGAHAFVRGGIPFSLSLPTTGWVGDGKYWISKDESGASDQQVSLLIWDPDPEGAYADPCKHALQSPPAGPSVSDLATAVSTVPGTDVKEISTVVVGGHQAKHVVLTVREDAKCAAGDGGFYLWYDQGPGSDCAPDVACARYATALGDRIHVWIVEVGGKRLFLEAETRKDASPEVERQIQQIVDSIQFG